MTSSAPVTQPGTPGSAPVVAGPDEVVVSVDGHDVAVPKGTLIIRAAEAVGVEIPRFCDHPLLDPVAACRACLVEVEGQAKPLPACAITVTDGMKVRTAQSSMMADHAQKGVLEFLLINHPLDCPMCDKGGECPLQNQAMSHGRGESRFTGTKREFEKPVPLSTQILIDRERCVSCARCTRFADQVAGDPFITLQQRGARQIVGISEDTPFNSYFSGNTVQICPVGALTSATYRFRARPFDLVSTRTACEHCASGCALRTDVRRNQVTRRLAWEDPTVNEDWNCDKGRFAFVYLSRDRISEPSVGRGERRREASWPEATRTAAQALAAARGRVAVLTGGRLTLEDAYAYSKFARAVLGTDSIDFRSRPSSEEEADLLRGIVAGSGLAVTYADLDRAPVVLLVGLDPEEESPIIFLRLRTAVRGSTSVVAVAPFVSPGSAKLAARVLATAPGQEAATLAGLGADDLPAGSLILVGERAGQAPGAITAARSLAGRTGTKLAWVPRRAGDRGSVEAGALPGLLPWGRPLADAGAREQVAAAWGISPEDLPSRRGLDLAGVIAAILADHADHQTAIEAEEPMPQRRIEAVVLAGVQAEDLPDPQGFLAALDRVPFVLSMETRACEVTDRADVVLPVGVVTEKSGTFLDWEGRARAFGQVLPDSTSITDARALGLVARAMGRPLGNIEAGALRAELAGLGLWTGRREDADSVGAHEPAPAGAVVLATWRHLLDDGSLQRGEEALAGTARPAVARMAAATAAAAGVADGQDVRIATLSGEIVLPLVVTPMIEGVVWVPTNSPGAHVHASLRVGAGAAVEVGPLSDDVGSDDVGSDDVGSYGVGSYGGASDQPTDPSGAGGLALSPEGPGSSWSEPDEGGTS